MRVPGANVRTFLTEAKRLEAALDGGEVVADMLCDSLRWWLYTHRTRRRRGDKPWQPGAFFGGTYGGLRPRRVVASGDLPENTV